MECVCDVVVVYEAVVDEEDVEICCCRGDGEMMARWDTERLSVRMRGRSESGGGVVGRGANVRGQMKVRVRCVLTARVTVLERGNWRCWHLRGLMVEDEVGWQVEHDVSRGRTVSPPACP